MDDMNEANLGKVVSSTNVTIAANKILEDFVRKPFSKNYANDAQGDSSNYLASNQDGRRSRLDRRDRSAEVQSACNVFDDMDAESFKESCRRLDISPVTYTHVRNVLQRNESILNLRNHDIGSTGALAVVHELTTRAKCIVELDVSSNKLGDKGAAAICQFLRKSDSVVKVDFSRNALTKSGVDAIADILPENNSLKTLILSHNSLKEEDIEVLASVLQTEQVLETVNLSSNSFSAKSCHLFGPVFSKNVSLVKIDISYNHIGDEGVRNLVPGLIQNGTIRNLDLSWNDIADDGAMWMAELISANSKLRDLNLSYNNITSKGIDYLASSLSTNVNLNVLQLSGNSLVSEDAVLLLEFLFKNPSSKLRQLYLREVTISPEFQRLFQKIQGIHPLFTVWGMVGAAGQPIKMTSESTAMKVLDEYLAKNKLESTITVFE